MNKYLLSLLSALSVAGLISAETLTPEQALKRAGLSKITPTRSMNTLPVFTSLTKSGEPTVYIFDNLHTDGYIMISADDVAAPILGYSDNSSFNSEEMPPQMKWWIEECGRQIEYARNSGYAQYSSTSRSGKTEISPLLSTIWNQGTPFNNDCPKVNGTKTPTGCVATAMAQVMNYWKYPEVGTGAGIIKLPDTGKQDVLQFRQKKFDWGNMIDSYNGSYTDEQAAAVAYLMKACGYSCDMAYTPNSSGALSINAAKALFENFKYNPNLQYLNRDYLSATEWENIIYAELAAKRPVLYGGRSSSVGHEFVCDGYDGNGYFHFNWGWGGMSDGYFLLDALNPGAVGTGGGTGGGFNFGQDIVVGIQPEATPVQNPRLVQGGWLTATVTGNKMSLKLKYNNSIGKWMNMGVQAVKASIGVSITSIEEKSSDPVYLTIKSESVGAPTITNIGDGSYNLQFQGISGNVSFTIPSSLSNGKYRATVCCKAEGTDDDSYLPVLTSDDAYNYILFTKSGNSISVEELETPYISITESELLTPLYYGNASRFSISVRNHSEKEVTRSFYPVLYSKNKMQMLAEGITLTIPANDSITQEFSSNFEVVDDASAPSSRQIYTLMWYDPNTETLYDWKEQVTMNINLANTSIAVTDFSIPDSEYQMIELTDGSQTRLYQVADKSDIPFNCSLYNEKGYFGKPIYIATFLNGGGNPLTITPFDQIPTLSANEECTISQSLNFYVGEPDKLYYASLLTINNNAYTIIEDVLPIFFTFKSSSVDTLTEDNDGMSILFDSALRSVAASSANGIVSLTIYSLDGRIVGSIEGEGKESVSIDLSDIPAGVYIVTATDAKGVRKQMKIAR